MNSNTILDIHNLIIKFKQNDFYKDVIKNISFYLRKNEILGIVGESGSGKSVTALAILGLLPKFNAKLEGSIVFHDKGLIALSEKAYKAIRGKKIAIIFQEPMSSLNPSMCCGKQVQEILLQHTNLSKKNAKKETFLLFEKVKLPVPKVVYNKFPHELSGGQKQRVMIAMAIACKPEILIADEPTTALDVTVQKDIITLLKDLQSNTKMSIMFISHDLTLVSEIADRVLVMYKGKIVEQGKTKDIFKNQKNTYTKALINTKPPLHKRLKKLPTIKDFIGKTYSFKGLTKKERQKRLNSIYKNKPLLEVYDLTKEYMVKHGFLNKNTRFKAVNKVSFKIYESETVGLVGESGCGKSTLARTILMLDKPTSGAIIYKGKDITKLTKDELRQLRKEIQIIFQDPYASLNQRLTIGSAITEPMKVHKIYNSKLKREEEAFDLLDRVGLSKAYFYRYPHELSGGQRQRVGIARALAVKPKLIVCDESVSALDISVQAQVLNLLNSLKNNFGFSYLFISHDLSVVKHMSDQLLVMNKGEIEESGEADAIYKNPESIYTKKLIDAIPKGL